MATSTKIVINAKGTVAGGKYAHFKVLLDGKQIGEATVGSTAKDYVFTTSATNAAHKIQIQYDNDALINGQDRNLTVNKVTLNGHAYDPASSAMSYDKGALDGRDVVAGKATLAWNGTLVLNAPASDFAGTAPTPTPTPTQPSNPPVSGNPTPPVPVSGPAFYVATNGNDKWSGKLAAPNADGTDGPFATLQKAQLAMRSSDIDTTYVRGGDYYLQHGLWLDGQDSGVRFAAYGSEKPVIHGGTAVTNWVSRGDGLWSAQLPAGTKVYDLTMDGTRQTLARTPNEVPGNPIEGGWMTAGPTKAGLNPTSQFTVQGDLPHFSTTSGLKVAMFGQHGYDSFDANVKSIDYANKVVTLESGSWDKLGEGSRFYFYNTKDQLNAAKEWAYDGNSGQLLFKPEGGSPVGHKVVVGNVPVTIGLGGAKNVTIEGLTLADGQPNGHAVYAVDAANLTFKNNMVKNTGYGVTVERGPGAKITGNTFDHTGREAIFLKDHSDKGVISDNLIKYASDARHGGDSLWVTGSSDVQITHNQIENSPGKAIAVGSVYGASDATYRNTIAYNKVINANQETADGGGIYLINRQQDNAGHIVQNNEVTGTSAAGKNTWDGKAHADFLPASKLVSWGIYLDDWTSGTTVKGNYVHGNEGGGVFLHGGWNNTVTDNLIAGNQGTQIGLQQDVGWSGWKGTPMSNNRIYDNVIDGQTGDAVSLNGPKGAGSFYSNDYVNLIASDRAFEAWPQSMKSGAEGTFSDWKGAGYDTDSLVVNGVFKNAAAGNYEIASGSSVYQHGFDHLPLDQMGLLHG
ncbi:right-handed parallel beta-helix repeat-containing protein [Azospirillum thermophilum]|uniref:Right handed beta helix domain-containing protein n=1 Tax=Azospirillum thermophilum TaxID=2202148 RepID=A0A2S2D0S3_9PROT|nr:carbohydrate-binding domain-containing protein [Azospirillum thermophilum]AWK90067.1 hypothetical protein DEW08_29205 [Azospirillum thermophilum]